MKNSSVQFEFGRLKPNDMQGFIFITLYYNTFHLTFQLSFFTNQEKFLHNFAENGNHAQKRFWGAI